MKPIKDYSHCTIKGGGGSARCCVYLMRHAQTYGNSTGTMNGVRRDFGLTAKGREQAARAARALTIKPAIILSSPQKRAMQTASYIARKAGSRIEAISFLHEQDTGDWTGKRISTLQRKYPEKFVKYRGRLTRIFETSPGGETMAQIRERARRAIMLVKTRYRQRPVLIVTHGVVIRAFLYEAGLARTIGEAMAKRVPNCSIVRLAI
ncbi:MAG: histidine phosphatase family protein [Candidatus Micrarchaeia archaeon]